MEYKEIGDKVYIKNEISWHIASYMMEFIGYMCKLMEDKEFRRAYEIMNKVICRRLDYPNVGEPEDTFAVIELNKRKNNK